MTKQYLVNEIFYSLQGEGIRAGTTNFFVRLGGCNLKCDVEAGPLSPGGFACDTEFTSGRKLTALEIYNECKKLSLNCSSVIFTGGEPMLQLDFDLLSIFKHNDIFTCVETNGTIPTYNLVEADMLDWVTLSPKVAEHAIKCKDCSEIKYVRHYGQGIPVTQVNAEHYLVSPAFEGNNLPRLTLEWCIQLVKENPTWCLSVQQHKFWGVR